MAHWGISYAIGPNYNKPWEAFEPEEQPEALAIAREAVQAATDLSAGTSPQEQALIAAIRSRYPETGDVEDFAPLNDAYANAMREVHAAFPGDLDLSALFAEAIMNRTPWQLWGPANRKNRPRALILWRPSASSKKPSIR